MTISVELIEVLERVHEMTELQRTLHREGREALAMEAGRIAGEAFELLKDMLFVDAPSAHS
jgi:hypothetical protein